MEKEQKYCLRWEHHQPTVLSVFSTLLENGKLVDITLAAEGRRLKAHRLVLSACSPYFEKLLSEEYDKHPILILKDVKFKELEAILDFMYKGEVNISHDQVEDFLKIAEALQLKGLNQIAASQESTNKKRSPDDGQGAVAMPLGNQKKQRLTRNFNDASNFSDTQTLTQDIPSTSVDSTLKNYMPNIIDTEPKILTQRKDDKNSRPIMNKDKPMDMQDKNSQLMIHKDNLTNMQIIARARHNLRKKTMLGRLQGDGSRDEVYLSAQEVVDLTKDSQDIKIFTGKTVHTIKMSKNQYFI